MQLLNKNTDLLNKFKFIIKTIPDLDQASFKISQIIQQELSNEIKGVGYINIEFSNIITKSLNLKINIILSATKKPELICKYNILL